MKAAYRFLFIALVTLVMFPVDYSRAGSTIVVPTQFTNIDGDSSNILPFSCGFFPQFESFRYQQIYSGAQIGESTITGMSFRLGHTTEVSPGFPPTILPGIQINMSTTHAVPGQLSDTYADNVGPDDTVVFFGDLTISAPDCSNAPCPFVVDIPLQHPFSFDPSNGNLLVDYRISDCINLGDFVNFDATEEFPGATSRVSGPDVSSPTGEADDLGLITQFTGAGFSVSRPVPTLSEWGMMAAAAGLMIVGVFFAVRRKRLKANA